MLIAKDWQGDARVVAGPVSSRARTRRAFSAVAAKKVSAMFAAAVNMASHSLPS